jgi:hypothetical protein
MKTKLGYAIVGMVVTLAAIGILTDLVVIIPIPLK